MSEIKRDSSGRFVKGTRPGGGPGRPKRQTEADYLATLTEVVTPDVWRGIVNRAAADALRGNGYARQWLSEYLIGKPPQILDIRAGDAKLLARLLEALKAADMEPAEVFERMIQRVEQKSLTDGR